MHLVGTWPQHPARWLSAGCQMAVSRLMAVNRWGFVWPRQGGTLRSAHPLVEPPKAHRRSCVLLSPHAIKRVPFGSFAVPGVPNLLFTPPGREITNIGDGQTPGSTRIILPADGDNPDIRLRYSPLGGAQPDIRVFGARL